MNTDGGILILGINDEKIVKGIMLNNKDRDSMGV
jgi:predicted HTH transcriptional regulator